MNRKKFYITAAIPYVNAKPHIGHAMEFIQTDVITRYYRLLGYETLSLSGGDENALKNVQAAESAGIPVQQFVDKNTELFRQLSIALNSEFGIWQKGSDRKNHFQSSQKLWQLCAKDIYKKKYEGLYCLGCEAFYTKDEINENGECFEHPGKTLQKISEENYFFALSKYQDKLIKIISEDELKILPDFRKKEVLSFLRDPLIDISISRSNERAKNWGVPVPEDNTQRIYVWFDALNIYQSGIGFGWDDEKYSKWWPAELHVIGKGITRFHAIYWPAFLLSANLPLPKSLFIHGYLTINGQKMSKTTGNIIDPVPLINKFGADAVRYYLLAKVSPFDDGDFSKEKLIQTYNADLANGLGNLVARVAKMAEKSGFPNTPMSIRSISENVGNEIQNFRFDNALSVIWEKIKSQDVFINENQVWQLTGHNLVNALTKLTLNIQQVAVDLLPFLPETSEKIIRQFSADKIISEKPLFPRI